MTASIPSIQARVQLEGTFKTLKIYSSWWIEKMCVWCLCVCIYIYTYNSFNNKVDVKLGWSVKCGTNSETILCLQRGFKESLDTGLKIDLMCPADSSRTHVM